MQSNECYWYFYIFNILTSDKLHRCNIFIFDFRKWITFIIHRNIGLYLFSCSIWLNQLKNDNYWFYFTISVLFYPYNHPLSCFNKNTQTLAHFIISIFDIKLSYRCKLWVHTLMSYIPTSRGNERNLAERDWYHKNCLFGKRE